MVAVAQRQRTIEQVGRIGGCVVRLDDDRVHMRPAAPDQHQQGFDDGQHRRRVLPCFGIEDVMDKDVVLGLVVVGRERDDSAMPADSFLSKPLC